MPLLTVNELRSLGGSSSNAGTLLKTASTSSPPSWLKTYDIFLSHRRLDASIVLGLKQKLSVAGYTSYVYWLDDPISTTDLVTPTTAEKLRDKMNHCRGLIYAATASSTQSKWMPWELGYMDGKRGTSAIAPIVDNDSDFSRIRGQEYLGIYPYIDATDSQIWVNYGPSRYKTLRQWLDDPNPTS